MPTDPTPGGALTGALRAAGHAVRACGWCGAALAADIDHHGEDLPNRSRRYCSEQHRSAAARARAQTAAPTAHPARAQLVAHGQARQAGQLTIPDLDTPEDR